MISRLPRTGPAPDTADLAVDGAHGAGGGLQAALGELGEVDRRLLTMVVVDGYSLADAAAQLGLTHSAVKSRLHRARTRMRASLSQPDLEKQLRQPGGTR